MENKTIQILFSTLLLSCLIAQSSAKMQTDAFSPFYDSKPNNVIREQFIASDLLLDVENIVYSQEGLKKNDLITSLPGQPKVEFKQYGGYVTVDRNSGRAFYYYFVEAHRAKNKLPLLLWLNGGPGCSSLAFGAMQELGPFHVHSDGKTLYENNLAWNHAANVLFLESPAGVGFSYSNKTADTMTGGDKRTAIDNYAFLLNWLERFPEYKDRDFYIAGESYAGHYVPQLAQTILHHNRKAKKTIINLKGIIIGNAAIDDESDTKGMYEYFGTHALISDDSMRQIMKYCDFSPNATKQPDECMRDVHEADKLFNAIDIYNIYAPLCFNPNLTVKPKKISANSPDPCSDYYVYAYLNRPEVQEALHANVTKIHYDWQPCSDVLRKWEDRPASVLDLLKEIMTQGLRVWIFSGDTDGRVPVTSTQLSIKKMKLKIKTSWHPWYLSQEVGGYTQSYTSNLTFATVRGAGHQVPRYQSARSLSLIMHFLAGTELPNSFRNQDP